MGEVYELFLIIFKGSYGIFEFVFLNNIYNYDSNIIYKEDNV